MTTISKKIAYATRLSGNIYDVTYQHGTEKDSSVPYSYIRGLLAKGYTVEIDQTGYCPEGEPKKLTMTPE